MREKKLYSWQALNLLESEKHDLFSDSQISFTMQNIKDILKLNSLQSDPLNDMKKNIKPLHLFLMTSMINHCCLNNCVKFTIGDYVFVLASRAISAGDELFLTYVENIDEVNNKK